MADVLVDVEACKSPFESITSLHMSDNLEALSNVDAIGRLFPRLQHLYVNCDRMISFSTESVIKWN